MAGHPDDPNERPSPAAGAVVDQARVDELTRAIAAGRYVIDPERIAEILVDGGFPNEINPK